VDEAGKWPDREENPGEHDVDLESDRGLRDQVDLRMTVENRPEVGRDSQAVVVWVSGDIAKARLWPNPQ
jgi:hypothetical protein